MATRLKNLGRDTPMLLPPDLRDWVPENHIVHFLIDAVDRLPAEYFQTNQRGTGDEQYPPRMMLTLLIYCYATGRFSSRGIEEATHSDVVVRYICGGNLHPDHDTICTFRHRNRALFEKAFVEVLLMAQETAGLKKVGTVSIDGTKIKANASKHSAVSYKHAGEQIELLRREVGQLTAKAEQTDNIPLDDGLSIPDEIARREDRVKSLEHARSIIEERYEEERRIKQAEYEEKKAAHEEKRKNKKPRGKEPRPPSGKPPDKMQYNFTDPQSRIMKAGGGNFEQAYNAQAAVDTETMLVAGGYVTDAPTDKQQLVPAVESISEEVAAPENILADTGQTSAVIYSLIETCRKLGINPSDYLREVLDALPEMQQAEAADWAPAAGNHPAKRRAHTPVKGVLEKTHTLGNASDLFKRADEGILLSPLGILPQMTFSAPTNYYCKRLSVFVGNLFFGMVIAKLMQGFSHAQPSSKALKDSGVPDVD